MELIILKTPEGLQYDISEQDQSGDNQEVEQEHMVT